MNLEAGSGRAEGMGSGGERLEAILVAIISPAMLLAVAWVLPRSWDAWGIPPRSR